jgi:hypothetical protein
LTIEIHKSTGANNMKHVTRMQLLLSSLALAACASQQSIVDSMQPDAVHVAQRRGAFEMSCPAATAEVLSQEMIQGPNLSPRFAPPQRAEYTVGVAGCG